MIKIIDTNHDFTRAHICCEIYNHTDYPTLHPFKLAADSLYYESQVSLNDPNTLNLC